MWSSTSVGTWRQFSMIMFENKQLPIVLRIGISRIANFHTIWTLQCFSSYLATFLGPVIYNQFKKN